MTTEQAPSRALLAPPPGISWRAVATIGSTALILRLLALWSYFVSHPKGYFFTRPWEMGLLANSIIHGLGYSSPFGGSTGPTAFIAPGYPTLVAGVFLVFGSYTFLSALVILSINLLASLLTVWLIMHITADVLDRRTALLAGAFWAVSLPLLWVPAIFWESSLSQLAIIGIIALALRCRRTPTKTAWMLLGACCGIASLTNPALVFSLVAIMGWLAFQTRRVSRAAPILGLLVLGLVFAPWPIRNAYRFHAFIPLRSTVGFELWMGNRPGANGRLDESVFPMYNKQELAKYLSQGEVAYTRGKSDEAWAYIRAYPAVFIKLSARRFYRFWTGTGNLPSSPIYEIHALLTTVFGFGGLFLLYRKRMSDFATLMALPLILFPVPYYITHAEFRYRLNIDPVLTVLAAYAVTQLAAALSRQRTAHHDVEPVEVTRR